MYDCIYRKTNPLVASVTPVTARKTAVRLYVTQECTVIILWL